MKHSLCTTISLVIFLGLMGVSAAQETPHGDLEKLQAKWIARVQENLQKLEGKEQAISVIHAALTIADIGKSKLAKKIVRKYKLPDERAMPFMFIAMSQASQDRLLEALKTIQEMPKGDKRQLALLDVIHRCAHLRNTKLTKQLLKKMTDQQDREQLLSMLAVVYAADGKLDSAKKTLERISDKELLRTTEKLLEEVKDEKGIEEKESLIDKLYLDFVYFQVDGSGIGGLDEAKLALVAAQNKDLALLDKQIVKALNASREMPPQKQAKTHELLAVALAEVGRDNEAKAILIASPKTKENKWYYSSPMFGGQVLIYLYVRLDMQQELATLMDSYQKQKPPFSMGYQYSLSTLGGSYAYLNRLQEAEKEYSKMKSPKDRVFFASGVLFGLAKSRTAKTSKVGDYWKLPKKGE